MTTRHRHLKAVTRVGDERASCRVVRPCGYAHATGARGGASSGPRRIDSGADRREHLRRDVAPRARASRPIGSNSQSALGAPTTESPCHSLTGISFPWPASVALGGFVATIWRGSR